MSAIYFTDRDLGLRFPEILIQAGLSVERHRDHFRHDAPDVEWLESVGRKGWIALTHNSRIRYTPNEKEAVLKHGVALLVIEGAVSFPLLAESFVATHRRIEMFLANHSRPFIAKVYRATPSELLRDSSSPGRIELWYPK